MRKTIGLFAFSVLIAFSSALQAYESQTHRQIAERAAQPSVSSVDEVLRAQLGISAGIGERLPGRSEPGLRTIQQLIGDGARAEDLPARRALNHFHNPLVDPWDEAGLRAFSLLGVGTVRGQSSVLWQQNQAQDSSVVFTPPPLPSGGGDWSWQDARRHYLDALTRPRREDSGDQGGRDRAFADMFEALGHLTHLVQDATVPAHVRNDAHPPLVRPDWYEKWVEDTRVGSPGKFSELLNAPPIHPASSIFAETRNPRAPVPMARLIDADTFLGGNADVLASDSVTIGVAEHANGNFLSRGTRFRGFALPQPASLDPGPIVEEAPGKFRRYFTKSRDGARVTHFVTEGMLFDSLAAAQAAPLPATAWMLDKRVHEDYARELLPRAVGYSAALLDYLFRGKLDVDLVPADLDDASVVRLSGTNASSEALGGGTLTLYADDPTTGLRSAATALDQTLTVTADPGASVESARFQLPENAERFVAVYKGTLGLEKPEGAFPGGVIGKALGGVRVEEVFADGEHWKLRTPQGVFLLKVADLPLTGGEFEEVRWGDGDNVLVARTPLGEGQPNRIVVYEVPRQAGSMELVSVDGPDGVKEVVLKEKTAVVFPFGMALGTTVEFKQTIQYRQQMVRHDPHKVVWRWEEQPEICTGCAFYVFDHLEHVPRIETAHEQTVTFSERFSILLDLPHMEFFPEPYAWTLEDVGVDTSGRLLGLVAVRLTSPESRTVTVPFFGLNQQGDREVVDEVRLGAFFPPGVKRLLWALVDLKERRVVASTAEPDVTISFETAVEAPDWSCGICSPRPRVYARWLEEFVGGPMAGDIRDRTPGLPWPAVGVGGPITGGPQGSVTDLRVQGGFRGIAADGWLRSDLNNLGLFSVQLGAPDLTSLDMLYCLFECNTLRVSEVAAYLRMVSWYQLREARRSRPAPGGERFVFLADRAGEARVVISWDPEPRSAQVLHRLSEGFQFLGTATGGAALVRSWIPAGGLLIPLDGSQAPTFFPDEEFLSSFELLNPSFLYNVSDLKFYRSTPPLQGTALPRKLADVEGNPRGDYHAIRLP